MPKLSTAAIEKRKETIEGAARELFIKQGFHRTSMRDICKGAEVSLGNLYNYYPTTEAIFESLINGYVTVMDEKLRTIFFQDRRMFQWSRKPQSLIKPCSRS